MGPNSVMRPPGGPGRNELPKKKVGQPRFSNFFVAPRALGGRIVDTLWNGLLLFKTFQDPTRGDPAEIQPPRVGETPGEGGIRGHKNRSQNRKKRGILEKSPLRTGPKRVGEIPTPPCPLLRRTPFAFSFAYFRVSLFFRIQENLSGQDHVE